jgi:hypothetical protein
VTLFLKVGGDSKLPLQNAVGGDGKAYTFYPIDPINSPLGVTPFSVNYFIEYAGIVSEIGD